MKTKSLLAFSLFTAAGLAGCTAPGQLGAQNEAALVSPDLVIYEVFGGGTGTIYTEDFVVLFNRGTAAASTAGLSLIYRGSGSDVALALNTASIPAGGYYLVAQAADASGTGTILTPDQTGLTNLSTSGGRVALANASTFSATDAATWVDLVGWGTSLQHEGLLGAGAQSTTLADFRAAGGCTDTGANSSDFATGTPVHKNSTTTAAPCSTSGTGDMATTPPDMTQPPAGDAATNPGTDAATNPDEDGGSTGHHDAGSTGGKDASGSTYDAGNAVGNQPQPVEQTPITPGSTISSDCSVGGIGGGQGRAGTSAVAGLLLAGIALGFRRRRAS